MENKIIIDGEINSGMTMKRSKVTNRPYVNFSIYVEPVDQPPFYFRCYASGDIAKKLAEMRKGEMVRLTGSVESALLCDESYGKQINCSDAVKL